MPVDARPKLSAASSNSPSTSNASSWTVKFARTFLCGLIVFTCGFLLVANFVGSFNLNPPWNSLALDPVWKHFKAIGKLSPSRKLVTATGNTTNSGQSNQHNLRNLDEEVPAEFREYVRKKTLNASTVAQYLYSVQAYLRSFRSPVLIENPDVHSWPETEEERTAREAKGRITKKILFFNTPSFIARKDWMQSCPVKECDLIWTYDREKANKADAVVYAGSPASDKVTPRGHERQMYVFFTMESQVNTGNGYRNKPWNSAFNWTWNFRLDSDIFEPVGYLRRNPSTPSLVKLLKVVRSKTKKISWMSSRCHVHSKRDEYVARLIKTIPVDHYGRCGTLTCKPGSAECDLLLSKYFFYLSFENSLCDDYLTEKVYKTFKEGVHVIPVVRGGADYSRIFPEGTYVDASAFANPQELGKYLLELIADEPRYLEMLWRKAHFLYLEHGIIDCFCQLCYKLHYLDRFAKTYPNLYSWYDRKQCPAPTDVH